MAGRKNTTTRRGARSARAADASGGRRRALAAWGLAACAGLTTSCGRIGYGASAADLGVLDAGDAGDSGVDLGMDVDLGLDVGVDAGPHGVGPPLPRHAELRAFPTAEGFGASTVGGRGAPVLHVTTLAASGPGSLAAAVAQPGPRTIVFDVSGHIPAVVHVEHGDLTIAGQTAPNGISIEGLDLSGDVVCEGTAPACPLPSVYPSSVVVRHLRVRGGSIRVHHAKSVVFDHVSVGNAPTEAMSLSFAENVTVQYCLFGETVGLADFGGLRAEYADPARGFPLTNLSVHHNLYVRIVGGYLHADRPNLPDAAVSRVTYARNAVWGARRPLLVNARSVATASDLQWALAITDNVLVRDPNDPRGWALLSIPPSDTLYGAGSTLYMVGNTLDVAPTLPQYQLIYQNDDFDGARTSGGLPYESAPPPFWSLAALPFPGIGHPATESTLDTACRTTGAFPRDRFDERMIRYVFDGTHDATGIVTTASGLEVSNPYGDLLTPTPPGGPGPDQDGDGMPDTWELARGLDPTDGSDGVATNLDVSSGGPGYTNLEVYLETLARARVP